MKARSLVPVAVLVAVAVAILAPAALARSTGVTIKLKGPSTAAQGATIKLTATISNPERADGYRAAIIMQNKDGHLKRIGAKAITWTNGGRKGTLAFWVKAAPSAMGIAKYRAAWMHPEGTTRSNVVRVEID